MIWLNPWIVRKGAVTSIERGRPWHTLTDMHATAFQIGHQWFRYRGRSLPITDGDRVVVVGWKVGPGVEANFIVLPDENKLLRPFSGWSLYVFGAIALVIAGGLLAKLFLGAGIFMAAVASSLIFDAIAWREGYRLALRYLPSASTRDVRKP